MRSLHALFICLAVSAAACAPEETPPLKPDATPPSTPVQEPLRPNGMTDYVRLYEAYCSQSVTAQNNAAPLLLRVLGHPLYYDRKYFQEACEKLNVSTSDDERILLFGEVLAAVWEAGATEPEISARGMRVVNLLPAGAAADYRKRFKDRDAFAAALYRNNPIPPQRPWNGEQYPLLDLWLRVNEQPLKLLKQAAAKERMYLPGVYPADSPYIPERVTPSSGMYREAAKLLLTRATSRLQGADHEGAWDDVRSCYRLAVLVAQEPSIMAMLSAGLIEGFTHDAARQLAVEGRLSTAMLRSCFAELNGFVREGHVRRAVEVHERFSTLDTVAMLRHSLKDRDLTDGARQILDESIDWSAVQMQLDRWCQESAASLAAPTHKARLQAVKAFNERRYALAKAEREKLAEDARKLFKDKEPDAEVRLDFVDLLWLTGKDLTPEQRAAALTQGTATFLIGVATPPGENALSAEVKIQMGMDLTRLTLALMAHRSELGTYPAKLSDLVPSFLPQIPLDHFSGEPLHYQAGPDGFRLYSVGSNLKDDGGVFTSADTSHEADMVVHVDKGKVVEQRFTRPAPTDEAADDADYDAPIWSGIFTGNGDWGALPPISKENLEQLIRLLSDNKIPFAIEFKGGSIIVHVMKEQLSAAEKLYKEATRSAPSSR